MPDIDNTETVETWGRIALVIVIVVMSLSVVATPTAAQAGTPTEACASGPPIYNANNTATGDGGGGGGGGISSSTFVRYLDVSSEETGPRGVAITDGGSRLHIVGSGSDTVYTYALSTPYNVSTASLSQSLDVSSRTGGPRDITFADGGSRLYITSADGGDGHIFAYSLSTPYDVTTASFDQTVQVGAGSPANGMDMVDGGTQMSVAYTNGTIVTHQLATPYDVSSSTTASTFDASPQDSSPAALRFSDDGTSMFMSGAANGTIVEYALSTPYDLSTATVADSFTPQSVSTGLAFGDAGAKMYTTEQGANVGEYDTDVSGFGTGGGTVRADLEVTTRNLFRPGETHGYTVVQETTLADNQTIRTDITDTANVSTTNSTILSVNDANNTLSATSDANTSTWVRVDANTSNATGCTNVIVSEPSVSAMPLLPGVWRFSAVLADSTLFALLIATFIAVAATRITSAFGGLAMGQVVLTVGWLAGYVTWAIAAVSLFVTLFIGLNLAANVDYGAASRVIRE